ncbi:ankyrin repeat-containing protein NPR4-like [Vigna radiata var. radiata]|uniref:Ankyrin repeat-containing protein NPR4-like n=1 Tax=Vigna radiata var. radiata TaxID=3916 RepID=A0A1S3VMU0_VIGRR|nr:ankyrin repeat-containing protein NPR4-like [Vigna radiata var. radiata]
MKNYLRGKNLWDVVESGSASSPIDAQKDAEALHIIQLSCAPNIFNEIKDFQTAHIAWNHLAKVCRSEFKIQPHIRHGVVSDNVREHKDLYKFVENGNWEGASSYLRDQPNAIFWAPSSGRTVLHVATIKGHITIVAGLVYLGKKQLIEMQDEDGNTALALAAAYTGNLNIARRFLNAEGGEELLGIENKEGEIPLLMAANSGCKIMTRYLFFHTPRHVMDDPHNRVLLMERCIQAHIFDVALTLLKSYEELPIESLRVLLDLARMTFGPFTNSPWKTTIFNFRSGTLVDLILAIMNMFRKFVESTMHSCGLKSKSRERHKNEFLQILRYYKDSVSKLNSSQLRKALMYDAMLEAAKHGNVEFINAMRKANHDLLLATDNHGRDILSYAVLHRRYYVFEFVLTLSENKDIINYTTDMFGNNLLHLAAHLVPLSDLNRIPSAAWQLQREIDWFKAVEEVVHVKCREAKNDEGKKPEEIFIETHKELMKDGEKLVKETAGTFAIVGVLVITVMFAAIFTVPGGLHQDTGLPIFIKDKQFTVFIVADTISLLASIFTVFIYIDLQTLNYTPTDFQGRLPTKIMSGFGCLSLSLVSMMIAFCAALGIVLQKSSLYKHIFVGVVILAPFSLRIPFSFSFYWRARRYIKLLFSGGLFSILWRFLPSAN